VLENLELTNFKTLPEHITLNITHTKVALKSLAAFQASSLLYEHFELRPRGATVGSEYEDILFETSFTPDNLWCSTGIRTVRTVALHHTKYGKGSPYFELIEAEFNERIQKVFEILNQDMPNVPSVLCHRDLWRNNLMFNCGEDSTSPPLDCQLIDFQIARYLPIALDVIICILLPSTEPFSPALIDECIKFHYEQLSDELKRHDVKIENIMSLRDFEVACEHFRLMPLLMQPMFFSLVHLPASYIVNLLRTNEEEYMRISLHHRCDVVLEFMERDEFYRRTMTQSVERLIEYLFKIC
jgi:hypothetical protein